MEAHRSEATLQVSGRLEKEGKLYWLYGPQDIRILESDESVARTGDDGPSAQMLF